MRFTHSRSVILLVVFALASVALAEDRQGAARTAAAAADSFIKSNNPHPQGSLAHGAYEAQRAATARVFGRNVTAANDSQSQREAIGRGATDVTVGALTQPVRVESQEPAVIDTGLGKSGSSYLREISALQDRNTALTKEAIAVAGQDGTDVTAAITKSSNEMILKMIQSVSAQVAAQKKKDAEAAMRLEAERAAKEAAKVSISDRIGSVGRGSPGSGAGINYVPEGMGAEVLGNLDIEAGKFKPFAGKDNIQASQQR